MFEVRPQPLHQRQVTPQLRRHVAHHHRVGTVNTPSLPATSATGASPTPWTNRRFCSLTRSPGAREFYDQKRAAGDLHHQALRALANRLVGILHGCLKHRTPYNEHTAWAHRHPPTRSQLDNYAPGVSIKSPRSPGQGVPQPGPGRQIVGKAPKASFRVSQTRPQPETL